MDELKKAPNLGKISADKLRRVGITNILKLRI